MNTVNSDLTSDSVVRTVQTARPPHTPGPWRVGGRSFEWNSPSNPRMDIVRDVTYVEGVRPTTYLIGHVCYPTTTGDTVGALEREANAHLIAAAPDLLAALRDIASFCDDPEGSDRPETLALGMARLLPAARAAIAKATGGAA